MKKSLKITSLLLSITLIFAALGCTKQQKSDDITLNISAAASLKDSMDEIKQLYGSEKANIILTINFGSSGTLQQQ